MRNSKSLLEKVDSEFPGFAGEVDGLDAQSLKNRIANYAKELQASGEAKEADEALQSAREQAKELGAPYRDVRKAVKLKTQYLLSLLAEKE